MVYLGSIAVGNRVNGVLAALMRRRTDAVIRQRNVGITEEELNKDECRGDAIFS